MRLNYLAVVASPTVMRAIIYVYLRARCTDLQHKLIMQPLDRIVQLLSASEIIACCAREQMILSLSNIANGSMCNASELAQVEFYIALWCHCHRLFYISALALH